MLSCIAQLHVGFFQRVSFLNFYFKFNSKTSNGMSCLLFAMNSCYFVS